MNELRFLFSTDAAQHVTIQLSRSPNELVSEPHELGPVLTESEHEELRWYAEEYLDLPFGGSVQRAKRVEIWIGDFGRQLYNAVFSIAAHRRAMDELLTFPGQKVLTISSREPEVLRVPWEMMADEQGPLTRRAIGIRRQLEADDSHQDSEVHALPLRVLLVVSRPDDLGFIDPRLTGRAVLDALDPVGGVRIDFCRPATLASVEHALVAAKRRGEPYHVVHFDGHGTFDPVKQSGVLYFEQASRGGGPTSADPVPAGALGTILAHAGVRLVILEACRSGQIGYLSATRSVAPRLLDAGIPCVLGMSHAVHADATRILLERFYRELVSGRRVTEALERARYALMDQPRRTTRLGRHTEVLQDWFVPQLYQRGLDQAMTPAFSNARATRTAVPRGRALAAPSEPGAFPRPPRSGFRGRASVIQHMERALRDHHVLVLNAMGGMGKTSLAAEAAEWWTRTGLFPDGACFVSFEQGGGPERAVQILGTYLDGPGFEALPTRQKYARATELFRRRRVLVVWDNFESASAAPSGEQSAQVAPPHHALETFASWAELDQCLGRLIVTCRTPEAGLPGAYRIELLGLERPSALGLLTDLAAAAGAPIEAPWMVREELEALLAMLGDHPLSIELVSPHLKSMRPAQIRANFDALFSKLHGDAEVERNRSLLASLEFSLSRLSDVARSMLPWLGLFRGGVFESHLLLISELDPQVWEAACTELEGTALIRREDWITLEERPFLRFHPTLPYALEQLAPARSVRIRFAGAYLGLAHEVYQVLVEASSRAVLELLRLEELNLRTATAWAFEEEAYAEASALGDIVAQYLQMVGRLRERDDWVQSLAVRTRKGGFGLALAEREIEAAWSLTNQGKAEEGVDKLALLLGELRRTTDFDPAFLIAAAQMMLGRIRRSLGDTGGALNELQASAKAWRRLALAAMQRGEDAAPILGNLATTLGERAYALRDRGRLKDASRAAKRAVDICRRYGHYMGLGAALGTLASVLERMGRYKEAESLYEDVTALARRTGDRNLEGTALQHQGVIAEDQRRFKAAVNLYSRALLAFQDGGSEVSVMRICNMLGVAEQQLGRHDAAIVWYERTREIATRRSDVQALSMAAQNLGIAKQELAVKARERGDAVAARELLDAAARWLEESRAIDEQTGDQLGQASSMSQLSQVELLRGELQRAEELALKARAIWEDLNANDVWRSYHALTSIARARGDITQAEAWEKKVSETLEEIEIRAGAFPAVRRELLANIEAVAQDCARAGVERAQLPQETKDALHELSRVPDPIRAIVPFLREVAEGGTPPVPPGLPKELWLVALGVLQAVGVEPS